MKKAFLSLLSVMFIFCVSISWAEYYQWVDKNGLKHFTDNVLEVPESQRPKVQVHKDDQIEPAAEKTPKAPPVEEEPEAIENKNTKDSLDGEKKQLEQIYQQLFEKKAALIDQQGKMDTQAYNEKVKRLNDEIKIYEKTKLDYEKRVMEYNKNISGSKTAASDSEVENDADTEIETDTEINAETDSADYETDNEVNSETDNDADSETNAETEEY